MGHPGSRDALLGAVVYNSRGVPNVVPNATSSRLAKSGPWTFMLVPDDSVQGEFIANYALDSLNAQRISVLYLGDEYGIGLRDGVRAGLGRRGTRPADETMIPAEECFSTRSGILYESIVRGAMRRTNPDVFVVTAGQRQRLVHRRLHPRREPGHLGRLQRRHGRSPSPAGTSARPS